MSTKWIRRKNLRLRLAGTCIAIHDLEIIWEELEFIRKCIKGVPVFVFPVTIPIDPVLGIEVGRLGGNIVMYQLDLLTTEI